jgi:AsmA protein
MRISRKFLIGAGVVVGLVLAALAALPFLIDANSFRPILQTQLQQRLQRPASLGNMNLRLFPFEIQVSDVVLGQPEGFASRQPFLNAKEVYVSVDLWPLMHRDISIHAIRLKSPRIELIRNPAGAWNYETGDAGAAGSKTSGSFTLDELRVEDGQVAIDNQKNAAPRDVYQHIDLTMRDLGPNRRGSLTGSVRLDTMAAIFSLSSEFDNAEILTAKGTATLKSDNNKDPLEIAFDVRDGAVLTVNSLTAKLGSLSAAVTGSIDAQVMPPALHLSVKTVNAPIGDLIRVAALYGAKVPADLKADGLLRADVQVTGTTEKPVFAGKIEATKAQITAKDLTEPVRSSELQIDFTPDSLTTHPFMIETGGTRLTAQAAVKDYSGAAPKINATLQTTGASVEELLRIASAYGIKPAGLKGTGSVNLDMKISATGKTYSYAGSGSMRNVSLTSPDLPKTLNVPTADIKFADDRVAFDHLQAVLGSMRVDGAGSLRDFTRPKIQFDLHVDQINVAELREWGGGEGKQKQPHESSSFKNISANGTAAIGKILYDQFVLNNVKATVTLANGLLRLDPVTAAIFGGQQSGTIIADFGAITPAYSVKATMSNVDANQLLSSTTSLKNVLSGALSGNADLQFLSKPNEDIAKTLNGKIQVQMGQGRLAGIQILNEVASIGHFLGYSQKSDAFTNIVKLTGSLNIQNGLASTNDLFMDIGGGTLSGAGTIGLVDQSLKLRVMTVLGKDLAQKSVLPGQIGSVFNTVLANQQGELVVPMLVTGTFAQPKFAPDAEQLGKLKLRGLLPTATNPASSTSGIKDLVEAITGKQSTTKQGEAKPEAKEGETKQGETKQGEKIQDSIINLFDQFRKKKDENKK